MLKKILRDNRWINQLIRPLIRFLAIRKLALWYRVYGEVRVDVAGVKFKVYTKADDHIANELYYHLGYEAREWELAKHLLTSSSHLIDVGANTGIFSLFAASAYPRMHIIAFEPHPGNIQRLKKNLKINNIDSLHLYEVAVGHSHGEITLTVPANLGISTTASTNEAYTRNFHDIPVTSLRVKQVTLDDALSHVPLTSRDLLKIDVEYHELAVLKGAEQTLKEKRPMVLIEILQYASMVMQFPEMKGQIDQGHSHKVFSFLTNIGYAGYAVSDGYLERIADIDQSSHRNFLFFPSSPVRQRIPFDALDIE